MSSDIPLARTKLRIAIVLFPDMDKELRDLLLAALSLMTRDSPIRRAAAKSIVITKTTKRKVQKLLRATDMTQQEIAIAAHLRNAGRVSEILKRKR